MPRHLEPFHHMDRKATWGTFLWLCSCTSSQADCLCKHGSLLTAVLDPKIKVPKEFVASEPGLRKKYHRLKGKAGPKRMRLWAELRKDKVKKASKIQFMHMEVNSGAAAGGQQKPLSESVEQQSASALPQEIPEVVIPESSCHLPTMTLFRVRCCSSLLSLRYRPGSATRHHKLGIKCT
jgi:hypothetical protein